MNVEDQLAAFLRAHVGVAYCDDCLKDALALKRRQQARNTTAGLAASADFHRAKDNCSVCGGWKLVTRAVQNHPPTSVGEFAQYPEGPEP